MKFAYNMPIKVITFLVNIRRKQGGEKMKI